MARTQASRRAQSRSQAIAQAPGQAQAQAQPSAQTPTQSSTQPAQQTQAPDQGQPAQQNQGPANNRPARHISGPQSALTDYLASHNISANQIRRDADRRRAAAAQSQQAQQDEDDEEAGPSTGPNPDSRNETAAEKAKRKKKEQQAIAKIKASKAFKKRKRAAEDSEDEDDIARALLEQMSQPMPGQFDNCDICQKRFTVTPYSRPGPNGGLLCAKCSKDAAADDKHANKKPRKAPAGGGGRRKVQSNILDGTYHTGAKRLTTLCIETLAKNVDLADSLGELPDHIVDRIARLFSKRRLLNPQTLALFLQPSTSFINIYDGAKLTTDDYMSIFQVASKLKEFKSRNAIQFKDSVMDYLLDRDTQLKSFYLHGANLLSDDMWARLIKERGTHLNTIRVYYTDRHFGDEILALLPTNCPNLTRLKVYHNQKVTNIGIEEIGKIKSLKHLGLHLQHRIDSKVMSSTILSIGEHLQTLSLPLFLDATDEVLAAIKNSCRSLKKLRIRDSDRLTDAGFVDLFTDWENPPLEKIDFEKCRHVDSNKPRENPSDIGLCSNGFRTLMKHSGRKLKDLNVHGCRHITREALEDVFSEENSYPDLLKLEISFLEEVDDFVVGCVFRSCPNIKEVNVFGCMKVKNAPVPRGKVLVGVPNAVGMVIEGSAD
ncbi:DNA repair protein [Colletotrichum truncatum]|uniref:DNA repair protein n=1 Tax=Colletotrichum truncatum TaxID=5467 RepID=A0ACC3ZHY8_COLTU|nr:DNA repair protein [Colletotrichum truncatum]KAF6786656.1 DNA repair protein [Colletotrichum truncatum]